MKKRKKSEYHTRAKYEALNPVILSPKLIDMYARMRKTEIVLHLIIQSRIKDGRLKRNIRAVEYVTGIHHEGLVEAEGTLKRMKLLKITREGSNVRIWSLPEHIGEAEEEELAPVDDEDMTIFEQDDIDDAEDVKEIVEEDISTEPEITNEEDIEIEEEPEKSGIVRKLFRRLLK